MTARRVVSRLSKKRPNKLLWSDWAIETKALAAQAGIRFGDHYAVGGDYDSALWVSYFQRGFSPEKAVQRMLSTGEKVDTELAEMGEVLSRHGFDPIVATALHHEGMGPHELEARARIAPGAVGSLEYTHNLKRKR